MFAGSSPSPGREREAALSVAGPVPSSEAEPDSVRVARNATGPVVSQRIHRRDRRSEGGDISHGGRDARIGSEPCLM